MLVSGGEKRYQALSDHPDYLKRVVIAEEYASRMLPFISRGLPVFQSHGISHSLSVIDFIHQASISFPVILHPEELFLLYLASWFHDLGYLHPLSIHDRRRHGELSIEMITADSMISGLLSAEEMDHLATIIRYHDSHTDLSKIRSGSSLRLPFITALFRLTDALDIGKDRCPPEVFILIEDGLDEHSRRHWKAHQNIIKCIIHHPFVKIIVNNVDNPFFMRRIIPHLEDDCTSANLIFEQHGVDPVQLICQTYADSITESSSVSTKKNQFQTSVSIQDR